MSKFSELLKTTFEATKLKRVRLKVDPAYANEDISKYQGYEGYILSEENGKYMVYVECMGGVIATIPHEMVDITNSLSNFEKLKLATANYLRTTLNILPDNVLYKFVFDSKDVDFLEAILLQNGCTERDLLNIFKLDYHE